MTLTKTFNINSLYPGGQGKCGIGAYDPYPSGIPDGNIFKTNISIADAWNLIWNLEDWNVDFDTSANVTEDDSTAPYNVIEGTHSIDGKFRAAALSVGYPYFLDDVDAYGYVLKGEPFQNVCGDAYSTRRTYDGIFTDTTTHSSTKLTTIMPSCVMGFIGDDPYAITVSGAFNIEDGSSNVVGNVNFSRYIEDTIGVAGDIYYDVGFNPIFVHLLGNGTVDLYFRATYIQNNVFGSLLALHNSGTNSPGPNYASPYLGTTNINGTAQSVTLSILGNSVSAYLWHRGNDLLGTGAFSTTTFQSFNYAFNITTTTLYTY